MTIDPHEPPEEVNEFLLERHLGTLTTLRPDGSPHVVPVGFTYDRESRLVRIITRSGSRKVANIQAHPGRRAAVCQVDGGRWLTLEGVAEVTDVTERVRNAVEWYATRYREPGPRDDRVCIEIAVDRILGRV